MLHATPYTLIIIVHVAAAALLLGGSVSGSVLRNLMKRSTSGQELGLWLDAGRRVARFNPAIALVVLGTGVFMGSTGWWSDSWFAFAAALWLTDAVVATRGIQKRAAALGAALGRAHGALTAEVTALRDARAWDLAIVSLRASNATMLYVMFQKPALLEAFTVLALAQGVSFGVDAIGRLRDGNKLAAKGPTVAHA